MNRGKEIEQEQNKRLEDILLPIPYRFLEFALKKRISTRLQPLGATGFPVSVCCYAAY